MARRRGLGFGTLLLAHKLYQTGIDRLPPVTLVCILLQVALYLGVINPPWDRHEVCLSSKSILHDKDYKRLFLSTIEHVDDIHLYHNMASLILKGQSLEYRFGSLKFFVTLVTFIASTSLMYVGLAETAYKYFDDYGYVTECAVGFSGVLFALKVLTTSYNRNVNQYIFGIPVPSKYAVWVELAIIHILVPRSSFIGHLAGILVGILFVQGPLRIFVDTICNLFNPVSMSYNPAYTYAHGRARTYTESSSDEEPAPLDRDFLSADELRRRRTDRFNW